MANNLSNRVDRLAVKLEQLEDVIIPLAREAGYDKHWLTQRLPWLWHSKKIDERWDD